MRGADPLTALTDLSAWLDTAKGIPGHEEDAAARYSRRSRRRAGAHLSALLAQIIAKPAGEQGTRESTWNSLINFLRALAGRAVRIGGSSAEGAAANPSLRPARRRAPPGVCMPAGCWRRFAWSIT